jgi:thioesterase domain-containing protein
MALAEQITQLLTALVPILGQMGFKVDDAGEGWVRTSMPLEPNHNHLGSAYAGSLFSMAEASGGALVASMPNFSDFKIMVKDVSIEYHRLALSDLHCDLRLPEDFWPTLQAQLEQDGKAFYVLPVDVFDADGVKVATAKLNYRAKAR